MVEFFGILGLAGVVLAIKFLVRRERPQGEWGGIYRNTDPHSFPSGHAARAFLIAVVASALGSRLAGCPPVGLGAAGFAGARGHGRALSFRCVAGAVLGVIVGVDRFADLSPDDRLADHIDRFSALVVDFLKQQKTWMQSFAPCLFD